MLPLPRSLKALRSLVISLHGSPAPMLFPPAELNSYQVAFKHKLIYNILQVNLLLEDIMRTPKAISDQQQESLRNLLGQAKTKADFQRVQCLRLRAALNMNPVDTAKAVGWSQST